jgi:tripartite-type tricarboxylate transporter receptor subunit TctC
MKKRIFREFFLLGILFVLVCTSTHHSWAAEKKYPSGPIDLYCSFVAGGQSDLLNRALAKHLEKQLGVTVVPGNKPGAGGGVAASFLANSRPDGYTMGILAYEHFLQPILLGQANYSVEDLRIVGRVAQYCNVMAVSADAPWKTFQEFVDYARKNPGVKYGHPGVGTTIFLRTDNLNRKAELKMVGLPFKGDPETVAAVLGKHVPIGAYGSVAAKTQADAGKMRILFSFDPPAEFGFDPAIPDLRTAFGSIADTDLEVFQNLIVPSKTPNEVVQVLERALEKIVKDPEFVSDLKKINLKVTYLDGNTVMQKIIPQRITKLKAALQQAGLLK